MREFLKNATLIIGFILIPLYTLGYEWNNGSCVGYGETESMRKNDAAVCITVKSLFASVAYPVYWAAVLQEKKS